MAVRPASKLAVSANYDRLAKNEKVIGTVHNQPSSFRATGKGLAVQTNALVANEFNANCVLVNRMVPKSSEWHKIYLYVDAVETDWQVQGQYAQAHQAKTFYPMNLVQNPLTLEGFMPNQYQYDRLVEFVERHHWHCLHTADLTPGWFHYIDLLLFRPTNGHPFNYFSPVDTSNDWELQKSERPFAKRSGLNYGIIVTELAAGHERFQFAPAFSLTCKVTDDRHDQNAKDVISLYRSGAAKISYVQVFGDKKIATATSAGTGTGPSGSNNPTGQTPNQGQGNSGGGQNSNPGTNP